jgi:hypothetical protein
VPGPRKRVDQFWPLREQNYTWSNGYSTGGPPTSVDSFSGQATQELLISRGNQKPIGDLGGEFLTIRREYDASDPKQVFWISGDTAWKGMQFAHTQFPRDSIWPTVVPSTKSSLEVMGTQAIAAVIPTNPVSGLAQFIGELREGLPSLVGADFFKHRASVARNAGSEYLNVQFGWLPLISDLKKFTHAVKDSDALLKQYERNSGKRIKRSIRFPEIKSTTVVSGNGGSTPSAPGYVNAYNGTGKKNTTTTSKTERWFSGCFTYYLPPYKANDLNLKRNEQLANYLYGTRPTPEVLWELAPWSWAADWFGNIGSVFHNVSAFANDGLVMPYAYMMERKTSILDVQCMQPMRIYGPVTMRQTFTTTSKYRVRASPFGFGLKESSLNPRQWAIISALGLTKGTKYKSS